MWRRPFQLFEKPETQGREPYSCMDRVIRAEHRAETDRGTGGQKQVHLSYLAVVRAEVAPSPNDLAKCYTNQMVKVIRAD